MNTYDDAIDAAEAARRLADVRVATLISLQPAVLDQSIPVSGDELARVRARRSEATS